jgi:hypothetical protein
MNNNTRTRITKLMMGSSRLDDIEQAVLGELMRAAYDADGKYREEHRIVPANTLTLAVLDHIPQRFEDKDRDLENSKRYVRATVNDLIIRHGVPICSAAGPGGGYWLPETVSEVEENHRRFHKRAMTGLMKATRARKGAYADAVVQLAIDFDSPEGERLRRKFDTEKSGARRRSDSSPPAWVKMVTQLLDRVKGDPTAYSAQIAELQDKYGDIFVRRDKLEAVKAKAADLLQELAGV